MTILLPRVIARSNPPKEPSSRPPPETPHIHLRWCKSRSTPSGSAVTVQASALGQPGRAKRTPSRISSRLASN